MGNDVLLAVGVGLLFGAVLSWPLALLIERHRHAKETEANLHHRRVTNARKTLAQPGTSPSNVKIARVERSTSVNMSGDADRHVGDGRR